MRGKVYTGPQLEDVHRITPAYAGKRGTSSRSKEISGDHPRVCGEKNRKHGARNRNVGSPPRMRGKVFMAVDYITGLRITPAYAGKSSSRTKGLSIGRDHPRVCGEKRPDGLFGHPELGSPPRMRGKGPGGGVRVVLRGITPAYAGKSASGCCRDGARRDHPRVCGEKTKKIP